MPIAYTEFLKQGSVAFDIGAYGGSRTDIFLQLGCSRVVTVEPVVRYFNRLKEKYAQDNRVVVVGKACGSKNGVGVLKEHVAHWPNGVQMDSALSSMSPDWIGSVEEHPEWGLHAWDWAQSQPVEIVTLDSLIAEYGEPDFIKIDVEGWEQEAIKGLTHSIKALSFEFHSLLHMDWTEQVIDRLLSLAHYEFNYDVGDKLELVSPVWLDKSELFWQILDKDIYGDIFARYP